MGKHRRIALIDVTGSEKNVLTSHLTGVRIIKNICCYAKKCDSTIQTDYFKSTISPHNVSTRQPTMFQRFSSVFPSPVSCFWLHEFDDTDAAFFVFDVLYDQGPGRPAPPESPRGTQAALPSLEDRPEVLSLHVHQQYTVVINVADEHASVSVCCDTPRDRCLFSCFPTYPIMEWFL